VGRSIPLVKAISWLALGWWCMRYARILPGRWWCKRGGIVDVEVDAVSDTETTEIGFAVFHSLPLLIFAVSTCN